MLSTGSECSQGQIVGLEFQYRMQDRILTHPPRFRRKIIPKPPARGLVDFDDKTLTPEPGHY
jgi:hypothetical protein